MRCVRLRLAQTAHGSQAPVPQRDSRAASYPDGRPAWRSAVHHVSEAALLGRDVAANDLREDYLRARLQARADGTLIATPVNHQDSSLLGNLAAARALVIRAAFAPAAAAGSACEILRLPA